MKQLLFSFLGIFTIHYDSYIKFYKLFGITIAKRWDYESNNYAVKNEKRGFWKWTN